MSETHDAMKPPPANIGRYGVSFDGYNATDANIERAKELHKDAEYFFTWGPRDNLRWGTKDSNDEDCPVNDKLPRELRNAKPTDKLHLSYAFQLTEKGETQIPPKCIVKSHGENHGPGAGGLPDTKGDILLVIVQKKAKNGRMILRTLDGKRQIAMLPCYGSYAGPEGGYRYYAHPSKPGRGFINAPRLYGYEIAEKAIRMQGSPLCKMMIDGKEYGIINPGFRDGVYRLPDQRD